MMKLTDVIAELRKEQNEDITSMRYFFLSKFPSSIKAIKKIDYEISQPKRRKGFNLVKRESKKWGHIYYVRYSHNGKMLPTKFCTHTNDLASAEKYAAENKERHIEQYLAKHNGKMFSILKSFYETEQKHLTTRTREEYKRVISNKFIPFLRTEKISCFSQIKKSTLVKFQDSILAKGSKPQTVNNRLKAVRSIFAYLSRKEIIAENPCDLLKGLAVHEKDREARGCYELEKLNGVFNRRWKDESSYLLTMLIYTTGLRNCEIKNLKFSEIKKIGDCHFVKVNKSKTASGERQVPLHSFVFKKLKAWGIKNDKDTLFSGFSQTWSFKKANKELARRLGVSDEELEREKITFYSGRHFWKTLMRTEGLGEDIEEIWMGHKVRNEVRKLYIHWDKQGEKRLLKKARHVFSILDRCIFKVKP